MMLVLAVLLSLISMTQAICSQDRCQSNNGRGGTDCWDGNYVWGGTEGYFPCSTGQARLTGRSRTGDWYEYTCCDTSCNDDDCRSPNGQGGSDCWADHLMEPATCARGMIQTTAQSVRAGGNTYWKYTCCDSDCAQSRCRSPDGRGGTDCWGGNAEGFPCSEGATATLTGPSTQYRGQTYWQYTCCINPTAAEEGSGEEGSWEPRPSVNPTAAEAPASGPPAGIIVAVVAVVIILLVVIIVISICCCCKNQQAQTNTPAAGAPAVQMTVPVAVAVPLAVAPTAMPAEGPVAVAVPIQVPMAAVPTAAVPTAMPAEGPVAVAVPMQVPMAGRGGSVGSVKG